MAHFLTLVVTRSPDNVGEALKPFWDDDNDDRRQGHFVFVSDRYAEPDPATGKPGYWKNPIGKWDGWTFGGRWDGFFAAGNAGEETGNQLQAKELDLMLRHDGTRLTEIYALLVHGHWRDVGEYRSSGKGDWLAEIRRTLSALAPDDWVSVIDCHC